MQILFAFFIFLGTASAHPHEVGQINHGPSLENYQIEIDFTNNGTAKIEHGKTIQLANKNPSKNSIKKDSSVQLKTIVKMKIKKGNKGSILKIK